VVPGRETGKPQVDPGVRLSRFPGPAPVDGDYPGFPARHRLSLTAPAVAPGASMVVFRAAALAAGVATAVLTVISMFSGAPVSGVMLMGMIFGTISSFVIMFVVALLPMPAAVVCRKYLPKIPIFASFLLSLALSLLIVFAVLRLIETSPVETDGTTTIYRHAGPSLGASRNASYYAYAFPIMFLSLVSFYWLNRQRARSNEVTDSTS
jgi:hypothetical protein